MSKAFDPHATEEEVSRGSQYWSKRDWKYLFIILPILTVALIPVYFNSLDARNQYLCKKNMKDVVQALNLYADTHDDRFPPIYREAAPGIPALNDSGYPWTWISDVAPLLTKGSSFVCPAADKLEYAMSEDPNDSTKGIPSTYGFYAAYGSYARASMPAIDVTILLGETSNRGALATYDPLPIVGENGSPIAYDGFLMGWNDSNDGPSQSTKSVTRMAWRNSTEGYAEGQTGRHSAGLFAFTASGKNLKQASPLGAKVSWNRYTLSDPWRTPINKTQ